MSSSSKEAGTRSLRSVVIGRAGFEKISAVEGIRPTPAAKARSREFEHKGLSPEERRRAIIEAYTSGK